MLLFVLAIFVVLMHLNAWRTLATLVMVVYSTIILVLGFIVGALWSWMFFPAAVKSWHISQSWVTRIVDDPNSHILSILSIPFVFVVDVYRWIFELTVFQGNPFLWLTVGIAIWKIIKDARISIKAFREGRQEMIDLRVRVAQGSHLSSDVPPLESAKPAPGYDSKGHFIGFATRAEAHRNGYRY